VREAVTVAIPSIPPRSALLARALASVAGQESPAAAVSVAIDLERAGAPATRQRALDAVLTPWVAFLDDDDVMLPEHLAVLLDGAAEHGADYVFSYYTVVDGQGREQPGVDPLQHFGAVFDPADPHQTTITVLVRTELARAVGFHEPPPGALISGQSYGEDFGFTVGCVAAGARIVHVPRRTWLWAHHGSNTSGRPDRW
jgi:glycosyltransferase involved in cell wall biosynthesis